MKIEILPRSGFVYRVNAEPLPDWETARVHAVAVARVEPSDVSYSDRAAELQRVDEGHTYRERALTPAEAAEMKGIRARLARRAAAEAIGAALIASIFVRFVESILQWRYSSQLARAGWIVIGIIVVLRVWRAAATWRALGADLRTARVLLAWARGASREDPPSSCRSRTQDFVLSGAFPGFEDACLPVCPEEGAEIPLPDPWIELRADGDDDLPDGLSPEVALRCILPQGINGCGFEQHLESMAATLRRSSTEGDPAEGFLRPDALLAIVVLTDEADCSYDPEHESIFAAEGERVFWEDPGASAPSSAVCWNAGVTCSGGPDGYDCRAADLGLDGQPVAPGTAQSDAVLRPVSGYVHARRRRLPARRERHRALRSVARPRVRLPARVMLAPALQSVQQSVTGATGVASPTGSVSVSIGHAPRSSGT